MKRTTLILLLTLICNYSFAQEKNPADDGRKIRIPVVFHVIYSDSAENIPDNMILNELKDLNSDISATNDMNLLDKSFQHLVASPNIEFYLLDTTLQKTGIKGVRRITETDVKNRNTLLINAQNCMNVFIADQGNSTPDVGGDEVDLNYKDVGTHGHTLTHETGHWLGLYHTFGQIGNSSWWRVTFGNHDDEVDDTPEQKRGTAICYEITHDCPCPPTVTTYKGHKTLYNNFMDYNPCRCMFTVKQCIRMRNSIIEDRPGLFK